MTLSERLRLLVDQRMGGASASSPSPKGKAPQKKKSTAGKMKRAEMNEPVGGPSACGPATPATSAAAMHGVDGPTFNGPEQPEKAPVRIPPWNITTGESPFDNVQQGAEVCHHSIFPRDRAALSFMTTESFKQNAMHKITQASNYMAIFAERLDEAHNLLREAEKEKKEVREENEVLRREREELVIREREHIAEKKRLSDEVERLQAIEKRLKSEVDDLQSQIGTEEEPGVAVQGAVKRCEDKILTELADAGVAFFGDGFEAAKKAISLAYPELDLSGIQPPASTIEPEVEESEEERATDDEAPLEDPSESSAGGH